MLMMLKVLIIVISSISILLEQNIIKNDKGDSTSLITSESSNTINSSTSSISSMSEEIISSISSEANVESSSVKQLPTMNLLLISGHANIEIDPGAVSEGRYEYAYNLEFVDLLAKYIKSHYPYINIILEDGPYKVDKEIAYIKKIQPDYVVNIHFNAGGGKGLEIITPLKNKKLTVATNIIEQMKANNLPIRTPSIYSRSTVENKLSRTINQPLSGTDYYGVINMGAQLNIISEIIEIEFIDNKTAIETYKTKIDTYVKIIATSIDKYYQTEFI
jgi:N-acetylmuramoyl-L-alanine amidase